MEWYRWIGVLGGVLILIGMYIHVRKWLRKEWEQDLLELMPDPCKDCPVLYPDVCEGCLENGRYVSIEKKKRRR